MLLPRRHVILITDTLISRLLVACFSHLPKQQSDLITCHCDYWKTIILLYIFILLFMIHIILLINIPE